MRAIVLSNGNMAAVDDEDYPSLAGYTYTWFEHGRTGYALRASSKAERDAGSTQQIYMHRQILGFPDVDTDHRNGDRLDNRRENLRPATVAQNGANRRTNRGPKTSRFKGVRRGRADRWRAHIGVGGRVIQLGTFATEEDAARAYDDAARQHFGEYARPNF